MIYTVAGATGNTGKPIAEALLKAGHQVRIISRDADKAASLVALGAQLIHGSSTDSATLTAALNGADAAYLMIPPNMQHPDFGTYQAEATESMAHAIEASGVKNVVTLSSVGAHLESGAGIVQGLHFMENRLNEIPGVNVLHLRPCYFLENTLGQAAAIKMMGIMGSPIRADIKLPMIATADIAQYAVKRLLQLDFSGKGVQHLLGAQDVTYDEVAQIYGAKIGKPDVKYVQIPAEPFKGIMMKEWGTSESVSDKMLEFMGAVNDGKVNEVAVRDAESTTPTSINDFANVFAHVYNG